MTSSYDLVVVNGTIVNHDGVWEGDIGVRDGKIAGLGQIGAQAGAEVIDARGLHVLPGVIDSHVHFREPGAEQKEDLETGSRAAVMGGVTTVFEMPNTSPPTTTAEALADKLRRAEGRMYCDHAFYIGASLENLGELATLERLPGVAGVKVFAGSSTGNLLIAEEPDLARVFARITRRTAFHSEDEARLTDRLGERRPGDPASHPVWRDPKAARDCTALLLRLARAHGKRIHILHVTTGDEMPLLAANKDVATVEVTPHHLTLQAPEDYERLGTQAQINPPVRDAAHRAALWAALADGTVDTIGSDHAPHLLDEKARRYPESPSGMPGVQTLVPVMLDHVNAGRLSLQRFVDLVCHGPQRVYGIAGKGRIAAGYDADLTLVDMGRREEITEDWLASRCGWSPYTGKQVKGWPVGTVVRGQAVMRDGELIAPPAGKPARFLEALPPEGAG
ncbi:dihydroorotase [Dichotomicrobium thermohalophilum]|uniref:Dihydroorotase n=1 Tax=Dichotomicrobium thermohalophilum TaxID=933063 RepID=A0A397PHL2_9HYPH|nr:dihydroorotase [Dichotomicrobium thermohalophilum]RIA47369.1 dihydroorotase [Dichotomicrobium thermohalophilum]